MEVNVSTRNSQEVNFKAWHKGPAKYILKIFLHKKDDLITRSFVDKAVGGIGKGRCFAFFAEIQRTNIMQMLDNDIIYYNILHSSYHEYKFHANLMPYCFVSPNK